MKGQAAEKVKDMPTKQGPEDFWGKLWELKLDIIQMHHG